LKGDYIIKERSIEWKISNQIFTDLVNWTSSSH